MKTITITIDYQAGSSFQEKNILSALAVFLTVFKSHYESTHKKNKILITQIKQK